MTANEDRLDIFFHYTRYKSNGPRTGSYRNDYCYDAGVLEVALPKNEVTYYNNEISGLFYVIQKANALTSPVL